MPPVVIDLDTSTLRGDVGDIELVADLDVLSEGNRCNCSASEDNPY